MVGLGSRIISPRVTQPRTSWRVWWHGVLAWVCAVCRAPRSWLEHDVGHVGGDQHATHDPVGESDLGDDGGAIREHWAGQCGRGMGAPAACWLDSVSRAVDNADADTGEHHGDAASTSCSVCAIPVYARIMLNSTPPSITFHGRFRFTMSLLRLRAGTIPADSRLRVRSRRGGDPHRPQQWPARGLRAPQAVGSRATGDRGRV